MASSPSLRRAKMMMMMVPPLSMHPIILAIDVAQSVGVGRLGVAPRESRRRRRRSARHFFVFFWVVVVFFRSFCRVVSKAMILYVYKCVDSIIGEKK